MPTSKKKRKSASPPAAGGKRKARRDSAPARRRDDRQLRAGMPAKDSVVSETTFTSPSGKVYRMIETNEVDEYEET